MNLAIVVWEQVSPYWYLVFISSNTMCLIKNRALLIIHHLPLLLPAGPGPGWGISVSPGRTTGKVFVKINYPGGEDGSGPILPWGREMSGSGPQGGRRSGSREGMGIGSRISLLLSSPQISNIPSYFS